MLKTVLTPIHPAGWPFILLFAFAAALSALAHPGFAVFGSLLTAWCLYFFRNPDRVTPLGKGLVISPADGIVQSIKRATPPPELDMGDAPKTRIAVFMNVFNVHVNRIPIDGVISAESYRPGKFFNASLDKASEFNERQSLRVTTENGDDIAFVQIAGLIARRILCYVKIGSTVRAGQRFGLIRFGSRVDIYLPDGIDPLVCAGQISVGGETVLANLSRMQEGVQRTGETR